nr:unnamed protein product [Spirometra erinaceieuropaei]
MDGVPQLALSNHHRGSFASSLHFFQTLGHLAVKKQTVGRQNQQNSIQLTWWSPTLWPPAVLRAGPHLRDDEVMVGPLVGVADRLGHHHVLSTAPPDVTIVQELSAPPSGVLPDCLVLHRQAENGVGQQETLFCAGSQKKETTVVAAVDPVRTQPSPPGCTVCPDARVEVTKENLLVHLRHRCQEDA